MATTNNVPTSRKSNVNIILAASGWAVIFIAAAVAAGFYFGYQYRASEQAKTSAAVKDALKAAQPAPAVAEASKN
jgi:uncharacterized protein HemX